MTVPSVQLSPRNGYSGAEGDRGHTATGVYKNLW